MGSSYEKFMLLVKVICNDTTPENPLTANQIISRMAKEGLTISRKRFPNYIQYMNACGLRVGQRRAPEQSGAPMLFWYESGWI